MAENLEVMGSESNVIYYNLNKQYSTVKKIIITSDIILNSYEESLVKEFFVKIASDVSENYDLLVKDALEEGVLDISLKNDFYKNIQDRIASMTNDMMDIKLQNYNFMNSVSNTKFNVVLRCESFSITHYYQEKGTILSAIKSLVKEYVKFSANKFRSSRISNFQIEIIESEELYKHIFLKKEGESLILCSNFGFPYNTPFDYNCGGELYFSKGEDFNFYKNSQTKAIVRDHTKLTESEIHSQEKVLSDENLILINNSTKNINDALVEIYLTKKGVLKIVNLSLLENSLYEGNERGFIINKSSKNYDKISLISLRDNLDEDLSNPKYVLIRNSNEVKELFSDFSVLSKVDGIIFNENIYSPILDKIGQMLDIDIVYYCVALTKSLEVKFDLHNMLIGNPEQSNKSATNPFANIIDETHKEKDEFLERLKNIDLNTPSRDRGRGQGLGELSAVGDVAQRIISSPNSSINNNSSNGGNFMDFSNSSGKKSAIGMLAEAVINNNAQPVREQTNKSSASPQSFQDFASSVSSENIAQTHYNQNNLNLQDFAGAQDFSKSSLVMNNSVKDEMKTFENSDLGVFEKAYSDVNSKSSFSDVDTSKYDGILATKLITGPDFDSNCYFVDSNSIANVSGGEIFFLTTNRENLGNSSLKYVLPLDLYDKGLEDHYFLVNGANDYFSIDSDKDLKYFLNLSQVDKLMRKKFFERCVKTIGKPVYVILFKEDLEVLSEMISMVEGVFVKDISSNDDFEIVKDNLLRLEKRFLMRNN